MWNDTVCFACGAALDVAGCCGASERHMQLAEAVHALNMRVYDTACRIVKLYCKRPEGARNLRHAAASTSGLNQVEVCSTDSELRQSPAGVPSDDDVLARMALNSLKCISTMQLCKDEMSIPQEDLDRAVRYTTHALLRAAQRLVAGQVTRPWQQNVPPVAEWRLYLR